MSQQTDDSSRESAGVAMLADFERVDIYAGFEIFRTGVGYVAVADFCPDMLPTCETLAAMRKAVSVWWRRP